MSSDSGSAGLHNITSAVVQSTAFELAAILSLIFGGCCSNAWALELATSHNPHAGTLITFAQYILIVLVRLPKQLTTKVPHPPPSKSSKQPGREDLTVSPPAPFWRRLLRLRLKKLRVPLRVWLTQVVLFWLTSVMNNWALGFDVNLAIQIIFRSGGLAANLFVGTLAGKKYTRGQVASVVLVTLGVACSALSSPPAKKSRGQAAAAAASTTGTPTSGSYVIGISILSAAMLLSAVMGIAQENANEKYGRGNWEESLFYLHFLGLPMFSFVGRDLMSQFAIANASPNVELSARSLVAATTPAISSFFSMPVAASPILTPYPHKYPDITSARSTLHWLLTRAIGWLDFLPTVSLPSFWVPLAINVVTQVFCVSGVNRLTSRASSLTVTLVLVVRKAVSLGISVLLVQGKTGNAWLWGGAALVLVGSLTYSLDGALQSKRKAPDNTRIKEE